MQFVETAEYILFKLKVVKLDLYSENKHEILALR